VSATPEACRAAYRDLLRVARRVTRSPEEARDLVQDAVVIALARGFHDWPSPARRSWLRGVVQKRAALLVREQVRRRRREQVLDVVDPERRGWTWRPGFLASLPRSLREVAALVGADLDAAEIRWILGLGDTAFRQRLTGLRRALRAEPEPTVPAGEPPGSFGPGRAEVLASLRRRGGRVLATHDPDGHPLFLHIVAHETPRPGNR
jgi:RNA polymerase sigma-70 factor (ECF subfamily)